MAEVKKTIEMCIRDRAKEPATSDRLSRNLAEKTEIARKCADFIKDGDSILLEVGTTTLQVAKALKEKRNLTVITNSIHVVNELMDTDFDIYVIGGKVRHGEGSVSGALTDVYKRQRQILPRRQCFCLAYNVPSGRIDYDAVGIRSAGIHSENKSHKASLLFLMPLC